MEGVKRKGTMQGDARPMSLVRHTMGEEAEIVKRKIYKFLQIFFI